MPFDQFTIEQLAGDLLPNATESQKIATGFHRCTMTNVEAGTDPEETRTNQVIDRVNTTATVWLGSTLECAQCHDHKYDPFSQKEYYQFFAFFNNTAIEADRANPKVPASIQFLGPADGARRRRTRAEGEVERGRTQTLIADCRAHGDCDPKRPLGSRACDRNSPTRRGFILLECEISSAEGATHRMLDDGSVLLIDEPPDTDMYTFAVQTKLANVTAIQVGGAH